MAADENRPPADRRLRASADGGRISERPFELERGHLGSAQPGHRSGHEAAIVMTPTNLGWSRSARQHRAVTARRRRRGLIIGKTDASEIFGDLHPLGGREPRCLLAHDSAIHRPKDCVRRHHFQPDRIRRLRYTAFVAPGAVRHEQRLARMLVGIDRLANPRLEFVARLDPTVSGNVRFRRGVTRSQQRSRRDGEKRVDQAPASRHLAYRPPIFKPACTPKKRGGPNWLLSQRPATFCDAVRYRWSVKFWPTSRM